MNVFSQSKAAGSKASLVVGVLFATWFAANPCPAQLPERLEQRLESTFGADRWQEESFGPARWLGEGDAYTTLEHPPDEEELFELVRYQTETGKRTVLVSISDLVPSDGNEPLLIEDYSWAPDRDRLLLFTNTKKVWRRNTRGDYETAAFPSWAVARPSRA